MSFSRCSSWPKSSLHYTEINDIMYAEETLYTTSTVTAYERCLTGLFFQRFTFGNVGTDTFLHAANEFSKK